MTRWQTGADYVLVLALLLCVSSGRADIPGRKRVAGLPLFEVRQALKPPAWAIKERQLLEINTRGLQAFEKKYYDERGWLKIKATLPHGSGAPDNAVEPTYNWPLLYALGGDEDVLRIFRKAWEGHFQQYKQAGGLYKEFIKCYDWEHNGEHYSPFYDLGLCNPYDPKYRERICRFADYFLGMPNYDPNLKIIRSVMTGSEGPYIKDNAENKTGRAYRQLWSPYWTARNSRGDTPLNMQATSLVASAFLTTGEDKYRNWVTDYVSAWIERANTNKGNFPGNISLNGIVGEDWQDAAASYPENVPKGARVHPWAGGVWAWTKWKGRMVLAGVRMGTKNAFLLTGDLKYPAAARRQLENLREGLEIGKTADGKQILSPLTNQGYWIAEDLYLLSMDRKDAWFMDKWAPGKGRKDHYHKMYATGHNPDWIGFLWGKYPGYPEKVLDESIREVREKIQKIGNDKSGDWQRPAQLVGFNPVSTHALTMLTSGARNPSWRGSPWMARLRYFDPDRNRPGLPLDVAALVDKMDAVSVSVTLVNVSKDHARTVVVQGGAYGEHHIGVVERSDGSTIKVNGRSFAVLLAPGSGERLRVYMRRFAATPTFNYPWRRPEKK